MNIKKLFQRIFTPEQTNNDVTKFLGIPVDGSPESMRQKLIAKGFKFIPGSDKYEDLGFAGELTGIFNNEQVGIFIHTNKGKVWRINVSNSYSKDEARRKFNSLVRQFDTKWNYTRREDLADTYYIPDDVDDFDFNTNVRNILYLAIYYQGNSKMNLVWFMISKDKNSGKYDIYIYYENLYNAPEELKSNNDVTEFLGIPVDGSPYSMRQKLIEKGFKFIRSNQDDDPRSGGALTGIFNNEKVYITIQKNPNTGKVWRIFVSNQKGYSKDEAITEFNNLVTQFDAKANYTIANEYPNTYYIPNDVDDLTFWGNIEKQKYQAIYYQGISKMNRVWFRIIKKDKNSDNYRIMIFYENRYNKPKPGEDL